MQFKKKKYLRILEVLKWSFKYLDIFNIDEAKLESEILLSYILKIDRIDLYLKTDYLLSDLEMNSFIGFLCRRIRHEPISYITGHKEFWSIDFKVNNKVLIPRPETECLVNSLLPFLKEYRNSNVSAKILDVGTGSGNIIISLAKEDSLHRFYAIDISYEALFLARSNARKNGLESSVIFLQSFWTDSLKLGYFDLIVSNPPYIKSSDLFNLEPEVVSYEPIIALDGGFNGLDCIKQLIKKSFNCLCSGGLLAFEIGFDQGNDVMEIIRSHGGYTDIKIFKDYSGHDRVVHSIKK